MNSAVDLGARPASGRLPFSANAAWSFVRSALSHASMRLVVAAMLLGTLRWLSIPVTHLITGEPLDPRSWLRLPQVLISAACILLAVLLAEEAVRRNARRLPTYLIAVVLAALVAGAIDTELCQLVFSRDDQGQRGVACWFGQVMAFHAADALMRGGFAALIYSNYQRMTGIQRRLRDAEVERAGIEQRIADEHLHALEARVDPAALFASLETIKVLYETAPDRADAVLDRLIDDLRVSTSKPAI